MEGVLGVGSDMLCYIGTDFDRWQWHRVNLRYSMKSLFFRSSQDDYRQLPDF